MFDFKIEIIDDELNLEDCFLESLFARLFIAKENNVYHNVVYINDLFIRLREWMKSDKSQDFIYEEAVELDYEFGLKKDKDGVFNFEGFEGTSFKIENLDAFLNDFMLAIKKAFEDKGEIGKKYYEELSCLEIEFID